MLPGITPAVSAGGIRKTWIGASTNGSTAASISFGNFTVPAGGGLLVTLLIVIGDNSRTMSSVSIGGSAATLHATHGASNFFKAAIASRVVAEGSHDVTAVLSGINNNSPRNFCGCWLLNNYLSATPSFAQHLYNGYTTGTVASSPAHDIPSRSVALYQAVEHPGPATWSHAAEDGNITASGAGGYSSWASRTVWLSETSHVETATYASALSHRMMNVAVWA